MFQASAGDSAMLQTNTASHHGELMVCPLRGGTFGQIAAFRHRVVHSGHWPCMPIARPSAKKLGPGTQPTGGGMPVQDAPDGLQFEGVKAITVRPRCVVQEHLWLGSSAPPLPRLHTHASWTASRSDQFRMDVRVCMCRAKMEPPHTRARLQEVGLEGALYHKWPVCSRR